MKFSAVFLLLCLTLLPLSADKAGRTYLPFNPADETRIGEVGQFHWRNRITDDVQFYYTLFAVSKNNGRLQAYEEEWFGEESDVYVMEFPTGRVTVTRYMNEALGIILDDDHPVTVEKETRSDVDMTASGELRYFDDSGITRTVISFTVRGDRVRFIENEDLYVTVVAFFDARVPFYGLSNCKIFSQVMQGGRLVRTGGASFIQFKAFAFSDAAVAAQKGFRSIFVIGQEQLLRDRPWTALAAYMTPADQSDQYRDERLTAADISVDMYVLAPDEDGWLYPGTVAAIFGNRVSILFCDADKNDYLDIHTNRFSASELRPFFWKAGTVIYARAPSSGRWIKGTIRSLDSANETLRIFYEDADVPIQVGFGDCRCQP